MLCARKLQCIEEWSPAFSAVSHMTSQTSHVKETKVAHVLAPDSTDDCSSLKIVSISHSITNNCVRVKEQLLAKLNRHKELVALPR